MQNKFKLTWDEAELAQAFRISQEDVREYLTDGRRVSFIIERRLANEHATWKLAPSEGKGYDLLDPNNDKWEVRSITNSGVYFTPSNQVGSGRSFNEPKFQEKLREIKGFILTDIAPFPEVNVYVVPVANVVRWYRLGLLGSRASISRKKFLESIAPDIRF